MTGIVKQLLLRLRVISGIHERRKELDRREANLAREREELDRLWMRMKALIPTTPFETAGLQSVDESPWDHPYLTQGNIARFRAYSEVVWRLALDYRNAHPEPLRCAFAFNMAQNMYKWARLAQRYDAEAALFSNVMDRSALNCPEWENFDGEFPDVFDGAGFLDAHPEVKATVPHFRIAFDGSDLYASYQRYNEGERKSLFRLLGRSPSLRHEVLLAYQGFYPYYELARHLSEYDVIYAASTPFAAYASGRPYCVFSVGGDLQYDCGRGDDLGRAMHASFNAARFLMISNPHTLGHSRRLGLINGVYLPYPMDDRRYCPGQGSSRSQWERRHGKGIYVLSTSRLDHSAKGYDKGLFTVLAEVAKRRENLRFIFLRWGSQADEVEKMIEADGLSDQMILLPPVGKERLIDYYQSCDIVLDHFRYGYLGATSLEAAAIGKPVIMKLRAEQYLPLYAGDPPPVMNADSPEAVSDLLLRLIDHKELRPRQGAAMRDWLVRTHGEETTVPLMLALLRIAADQVPLPPDVVSPLCEPEGEAEKEYHASCTRRPQ